VARDFSAVENGVESWGSGLTAWSVGVSTDCVTRRSVGESRPEVKHFLYRLDGLFKT
jgi:hypothetical protein